MTDGWNEYRLQVTDSLDRLEAGQLRIEERLRKVEENVANHQGKVSVLAAFISMVITGAVLLFRSLWHR